MIDLYEFAWVAILAACAAVALAAVGSVRPRLALVTSYLLVAVAGTKFRVREATDSVTVQVDWQILLELSLYAAVALLLMATFISGRIPRRRLEPVEVFLVGFAMLAVGSILWSPAPSLTAVRAAQMMLVCGLALTSVRLLGPTDTLRIASSSLVAYVIVCAGIAAIFGSDAWLFEERRFRFTWFAVHPLQAATWTAEAALLVLARSLFPEHRRLARQQRFWRFLYWIGLLSLFLVLVLANSRGPLIAFLAAAGLVVWKTARAGLARGVVTAVTVLVLSVLLFDSSIEDSVPASPGPQQEQQGLLAERFFRGGDMDTLRSLNGRLEVWEAAVPLIIDKPLLGYGYHGSRTLMFTRVSWASYAHSAYVQSLLDFGIVGALIFWGTLSAIFLRLVLRPFGAVTGTPWCDASMTGIVAFLLVSSVSSESLISVPGYEPLLMFVVAGIIGHYRSTGLKAFKRFSTTAGPALRLARQGGYRAYRDL